MHYLLLAEGQLVERCATLITLVTLFFLLVYHVIFIMSSGRIELLIGYGLWNITKVCTYFIFLLSKNGFGSMCHPCSIVHKLF